MLGSFLRQNKPKQKKTPGVFEMGQVVDKGDSYKTHAVLGRCLHGMFVCVAYLCSTQLKDTHWTRVEMQPDSGGAVSECVCVCV